MPAFLSLALLLTVGGDPSEARPTATLVPLPVASPYEDDQHASDWKPQNWKPSQWVEAIKRVRENIANKTNSGQTIPAGYVLDAPVQYQAAKPPRAVQTLPSDQYLAPRATFPQPPQVPPKFNSEVERCGAPAVAQPLPAPQTWQELSQRRTETKISKEQHLRSAADHLQAAGLQQESDILRKRADAESVVRKQRELTAKLRQLEKLKREIERLSDEIAPQSDRQLVMHISVVEVAEEAWQETLEPALAESISRSIDEKNDFGGIVFENNEAWNKAVEELRESKQAKLLSAPTLATFAGRPCKFHAGGQAPTIVEFNGQKCLKMTPFGTMIGLCPKMGVGDDLNLEIDAEIATVSHDSKQKIGGVNAGVVHSDFRTNIAADMKLGQSIAVVSPVAKRQSEKGKKSKSVRTILVVHPEAMKPLPAR